MDIEGHENGDKGQPGNERESSSMTKKEEFASLEILLHPLAVMNIADHHTRTQVAMKSRGGEGNERERQRERVIGGLIGHQSGKRVEVHSSYELIHTVDDNGVVTIDQAYLHSKSNQLKEVFPSEYDMCIGWYSTGTGVQPNDLAIHKQFIGLNETPLYLMLDPCPPLSQRVLPVRFYETETVVVHDIPTMVFSEAKCKIVTEDSERIAVDHVAHLSSNSLETESELPGKLDPLQKALRMLDDRLAVIDKYLQGILDGTIPWNDQIIRRISSLCSSLPLSNSEHLPEALAKEYGDSLALALLASVTKGSATLDELASVYNVAFQHNAGPVFRYNPMMEQ